MKALFRKEVYERRGQKLSGEVHLARPPSFTWLAGLIGVVLFISAIGLMLGEYPRKETVRGVIEPAEGVLRVTAPLNGTVSEILVEEGENVSQGSPLLRMAEQRFASEFGQLGAARLDELRARVDRIEQLINDEQRRFELEQSDLRARLAIAEQQLENIDARHRLMEERIRIQEEALEDAQSLAEEGLQSASTTETERENLLILRQEQQSLIASRLSTREQIETLQQQLQMAPIENKRNIDTLRERQENARADLRQLSHSQNAELRAPVGGRVSGMTVHAGSHVATSDVVLRILPDDSRMQAVLYVPTSATGNLQIGQSVHIRFDAFPYERFGVYDGTITEIGATTLFPGEVENMTDLSEPSYRVMVDLDIQAVQGVERELPLRPGMGLQADIILENRSLMDWLFDPIYSLQKGL